ncbi:hypothetical protein [Amycolatopsis nigrescens]|uniref:hypothetical protein n=1 Tax=Amycolatopsis nigrescens TaxID=381445 RepID=UPI00037BFD33|nr:hypothetical protein [Amycolatopsis nigrescens]
MITVTRGAVRQGLEVAHRMGGQLTRQIGRVGVSPTGLSVRMHLDQLAIVAGQDPLPDKVTGHRSGATFGPGAQSATAAEPL